MVGSSVASVPESHTGSATSVLRCEFQDVRVVILGEEWFQVCRAAFVDGHGKKPDVVVLKICVALCM